MREEEEVQVTVNWKEPSFFDNSGHVKHVSNRPNGELFAVPSVFMRSCIPQGTRRVIRTVTDLHLG